MGNFSATHLIIFLLIVGLILVFGGAYIPHPIFLMICGVALIVVLAWAVRMIPGAGPMP